MVSGRLTPGKRLNHLGCGGARVLQPYALSAAPEVNRFAVGNGDHGIEREENHGRDDGETDDSGGIL